jgi:hypothetical protein
MKAYAGYVDELHDLIGRVERGVEADLEPRCSAALNGQAGEALRRLVPLSRRRRAGAFFTGHELALFAVSCLPTAKGKTATLTADVTCGAGDLLLATARTLAVKSTVEETLSSWGALIGGCDIEPTFVQAARLRLHLLALHRGAKPSLLTPAKVAALLPYIRVGDYRVNLDIVKLAGTLLLNPPFTEVQAPDKCPWASGGISAAARCIDECLANANPGTRLGAILPDVLRTGERYGKWRQRIESMCDGTEASIFGLFDNAADVDVFVLTGVRSRAGGERSGIWWSSRQTNAAQTIGDHFEVCVGTVVPHRDPEDGALHSYIHAKKLPRFGILNRIREARRHLGRSFKPPFLVVRRTSRPGDRSRCVTTLVTGKRRVFVENHLIVVGHRGGSLAACRRLMKYLESEAATRWLDERIRCRHLTVAAVSGMPLPLDLARPAKCVQSGSGMHGDNRSKRR